MNFLKMLLINSAGLNLEILLARTLHPRKNGTEGGAQRFDSRIKLIIYECHYEIGLAIEERRTIRGVYRSMKWIYIYMNLRV